MKKKILLSLGFVSLFGMAQSQSIIQNGNFETSTGTYFGNPGSFNVVVDGWTAACGTGSPDYFKSGQGCYSVPNNTRSISRTVNQGGGAYIGVSGNYESVLGTLTKPLKECPYEISLAIAPRGNNRNCPNIQEFTTNQTVEIELVLRGGPNPCSTSGLTIYSSGPITLTPNTNAPWTTLNGTWTPTQAQVNAGYDRIEVRQIVNTNGDQPWVYIDDISMIPQCCPEKWVLEANCEEGTAAWTNIPVNSTVIETMWYYTPTQNGTATIMGLGTQTAVPAIYGTGWYHMEAAVELEDGTICSASGSVFYDDTYCCWERHNFTFEASFDPGDIENVVPMYSSYWGMDVPVTVVCYDEEDRIFVAGPNCPVEGYAVTSAGFSLSSWTDITTPTLSIAGSGTIQPINIMAGNPAIANMVNNLTFYVTSPYLNPNTQQFNILYYPTYACSSRPKSLSGEAAHLNSELEVKIAPNPTTESTSVVLSKASTGTLKLVSMEGRELNQIKFVDQNVISLQLKNYPSGIYTIQLEVEEQVFVDRIIKK